MKRKTLFLALLATVAALSFAQDAGSVTTDTLEAYYQNPLERGTQGISFNLGGIIPRFFLNPAAGAILPTQMWPGAAFGISYEYFVDKSLSVGASFGGCFMTTVTGQTLFMVPVLATISYYFVFMPFEIAPVFEAGAAWMKVNELLAFQPLFKLGVESAYRVNKDWSLGLALKYWLVPELYSGDLSADSRLGNFLEISLLALYHF
jgi:hypothetical protein